MGRLVLFGVLAAGCSSTADANESGDILRLLSLGPGDTVADIGAGDGEWTLPLAEKVGDQGRVWATEVGEDNVEDLRQELENAGLENVRVVQGNQKDLGLPEKCCDAVLLRLVYHHFTDPAAMRRDLLSVLKPGARLLVIDITPQKHWQELEGVPDRGGHGIEIEELIGDLEAEGLRAVERTPRWQDDEDRYAVLFVLP